MSRTDSRASRSAHRQIEHLRRLAPVATYALGAAAPLNEPWEPVHQIEDYYDGPRTGIASIKASVTGFVRWFGLLLVAAGQGILEL